MPRLKQTIDTPTPGPESMRRPLHPAELAIMATAAGAAIAVLLALLAERPWGELWRWLAIGAGVPLALLFVATMLPLLMWAFENFTRQDLDHDGAIGRPGHLALLNPDQARAAIETERAERDASATLADLLRFVDKCAAVGTSETAHGVKPNTEARVRYCECRDVLLRLGLAEWRNQGRPTAGWILNASPEVARRVIADHVAEL